MNLYLTFRRLLGLKAGPTRAELADGQNMLWKALDAQHAKAAALTESLVTAFENAETLRGIADKRAAELACLVDNLEATLENLACGESIAERINDAINYDEIATMVAENHAADIAGEIDIAGEVENALDALGIEAPNDTETDDNALDCPNTQGIDDVCAIVISQGQEITDIKARLRNQTQDILKVHAAADAFAAAMRPTRAEQVMQAQSTDW